MREITRFGADWCIPCHKLDPILDQLEEEGVKITRVDVDRAPHEAKGLGITSVPTMLLYEDGELITEIVGVRTKQQILAWFGQ